MENNKSKYYAISSLICFFIGLVSIFFINYYSRYIFFLAILLGVSAINEDKKRKKKLSVIAIVSIVLSVIMVILLFLALYNSVYTLDSFQKSRKENKKGDCITQGGICVERASECMNNDADYIFNPNLDCEKSKVCCIPIKSH